MGVDRKEKAEKAEKAENRDGWVDEWKDGAAAAADGFGWMEDWMDGAAAAAAPAAGYSVISNGYAVRKRSARIAAPRLLLSATQNFSIPPVA
ncbi:MAG: hypothetical protein NTV22_12280 [bacterium]|nr:hypothetical protein [bacterium]